MTYSAGEWNIICDVCGVKIKASASKKRWDGAIVCPQDYEERHVQEFLRVHPDKITVPFIRHVTPVYGDAVCSIPGRSPYADYGTADCMTVGNFLYSEQDLLDSFICSVEGNRPDSDFATANCATVR